MITTKKTFLFFYLLLFISVYVHAQQGLNAAGGNAIGSGGSINYSIGQIDYISANGFTGTIIQGLQQPYEIAEITMTLPEPNQALYTATVYPNPMADFIILKIENPEKYKFNYELYNASGNPLLQNVITSSQTTISMSELPNACYYLKILNNRSEEKIFKIIKNQ